MVAKQFDRFRAVKVIGHHAGFHLEGGLPPVVWQWLVLGAGCRELAGNIQPRRLA
jgi:hypothetical protein